MKGEMITSYSRWWKWVVSQDVDKKIIGNNYIHANII
jgi:hypothetical protein